MFLLNGYFLAIFLCCQGCIRIKGCLIAALRSLSIPPTFSAQSSTVDFSIMNVTAKTFMSSPTKNENGDYSIFMTYCTEGFSEDAPTIVQELFFDKKVIGRNSRIWCIDKQSSNPYRMYDRMGKPEMTDELVKILKAEGNIKPLCEFEAKENIKLELSANAVYLVEIM
jgi:hypothetical protein